MTSEDLKLWRERVGLSQSQLARALAVDVMTVSRWERGVRDIPPYLHLALWAVENKPGVCPVKVPPSKPPNSTPPSGPEAQRLEREVLAALETDAGAAPTGGSLTDLDAEVLRLHATAPPHRPTVAPEQSRSPDVAPEQSRSPDTVEHRPAPFHTVRAGKCSCGVPAQ